MTHHPKPVSPPNLWILPGLAGEIVRAIVMIGIDPAIALMAVLACVSLLTQGIANVAWPNGMVIPVGFNGLLVAPSNWGKSVVLRILTSWIQPYLAERVRAGLQSTRKPLFFIEDTTREAAIQHLNSWPVAALLTAEAGLLKVFLRNGAPTLAKLLDGEPLHHARISSGRVELFGHRLTLLAMLQPNVFEDMRTLFGMSSGYVGIPNRMHFGKAYTPPNLSSLSNLALPTALKARYEPRGILLLDQTIDLVVKNGTRRTVPVDVSGERRLVEIVDEWKSVRHEPELSMDDEYKLRHGERVRRLGASLHVFNNGATGEVGLESVEAAHQIGLWSTETHTALAYVRPKLTKSQEDASRLYDALIRLASKFGPLHKLSELRRTCANIGFTHSRFNNALPVLAGIGKITIFMQGRVDMVYVNVPPADWLGFNSYT